ncbi:uncharacterized protein [Epargyreus clarus]|uniref:uncharacterized protein n=1 Tax=Epargyreus clarus TaxID=520877 RepID=UPI003C2F1D77
MADAPSGYEICDAYQYPTTIIEFDNHFKQKIITRPNADKLHTSAEEDPYETFQDVIYTFLFGDHAPDLQDKENYSSGINETDLKNKLLHYPTGQALRKAELFANEPSVHLPFAEMVHRGHCMLNITDDHMQTAVDAFAIFVEGTVEDIKRLPADYVLRSARTISMLKISREKLAMTWIVVKGSNDTIHVSPEVLEMYRPLFKHINAREMARLNLLDDRILNYIGTHPDLDRHQVGVIASKYIKLNRRWQEPNYLNLMNNLLCGVPMAFMRKIAENIYLQLSHQVFYHTRACDSLQLRFYLAMMTKTQALGKAYSWNALDVSRLGLLLTEVPGRDLASIKPEALAGLTTQVMARMQPENLRYLTDHQLQFLSDKPLNVLNKKLKTFDGRNLSSFRQMPLCFIVFINVLAFCAQKYEVQVKCFV